MHKRYLRIETIALSVLNNAEFLKLMRRIIFRIPRKASSSGGEDLPEVQSADMEEISEEVYIDQELVDELEGYLDQMDELTRETTATLTTEELQKLEKQRDTLAGYIISTSLQATYLPIAEKSKAGKEIYIVVKPYQGIGKEPNEQETTLIKNMLGDIESHNLSSQMILLGLDDVAADLKRINDQYEELSAGRDKPKARQRVREKVKELRAAATEVYQEIADRAFAANLLHPTAITEEYVLDINNELLLAEENYNRRKKGEDDKTSEDEKPSEEKPSEEKPSGEKPSEEKPSEEKPSEEKPSEENPSGENPDTETPDTENPSTPPTGETEEPDDRPVVQ